VDSFNVAIDRLGTACIKWDFRESTYGIADLLPFSIADADYRVNQPILDALKKRIDSGVIGYTDIDESYLSAIAGWVGRRHGWDIDPEWIVPTEGIVPTLANIIEAFTKPGDGVIVQSPIYDPFFTVIKATGRTVVENDLIKDDDGYHMDLDGLERIAEAGAKLLLLCSPHNPVCRLWTAAELEQLAAVCIRHQILVVSDEIHWDLVLGGRKHVTMGVIPGIHDQLIVGTSCSKTFNMAGLETSNFIVPNPDLRKTLRDFLFGRYLFCPNTLGLEAAKAACNTGDEWVDEQTAFLTHNADIVCDFVAEQLPKVTVAKPEATYLLWFDMTAYGLTSDELVHLIAEHGAGLNSGHHYGERYDGYVRMNIACPIEQLTAGLNCIKNALDSIDQH